MRHLLVLVAGILSLPTTAAAATPPTLISVDHVSSRPAAVFSAPGAETVTVYVGTDATRLAEGKFFGSDVVLSEELTPDAIAAGSWTHTEPLESGDYYAMVTASTFSCAPGGNCIEGFSDVMPLTIPPATLSRDEARYAVEDTMSTGKLRREWGSGYNHRISKCTRRSRLRVRCRVSWNVGDLGFAGTATVSRGVGNADRVRWTIRMTNYYCKDTGGKNCVRTYRSASR